MLLDAGTRADADVLEERPRVKIHQSSLCIAFFYTQVESNEDILLVLPMVAPLQVTDTGHAESAVAAWSETLYMDKYDEVKAFADVSYTMASMDRDAANIKGFRCWAATNTGDVNHRSGCIEHCLFTVSGGMFLVTEWLVSGTIALDMATRSGSHYKKLKNSLVDVLKARCKPINGEPPVEGAFFSN